MSAGGPVDLGRQGERQQAVAVAVWCGLADVSWEHSETWFTQAGDFTAGVVTYIDDAGERQSMPMPADAVLGFVRLRDEMWNPATLPWYHAQLTLTPAGDFDHHFNHERRFDIGRRPLDRVSLTDDPRPSDADLIEDLRRFPRSSEHVPDWQPRA